MKDLRHSVILLLVMLLSACMGPKTPQEVTRAFWEAVIADDADDVVGYSTLVDAKQYDRFSRDWSGYQASWGKVVIDGERASVESRLSGPGEQDGKKREFTTYLVLRNGEWFVDYDRTGESVQGNVISSLLGKLSEVGKELSAQLESAAKQFDDDMMRLSDELEKKAGELDQKASESVKEFARELQESIRELEESINRALEDRDKELSDEDRSVLREVSTDLNRDSESLSEPSVAVIAESSKDIARARVRLESIDEQSAGEYKQQWRDWSEKVEADLKKMLQELSAKAEG